MSYVFVPSAPSERAQRLATRLAATIDEFRRGDPGVSGTEIQQALRLAAQQSGGTKVPMAIAIAVSLLLGVGVLFFVLYSGNR